MSSDNDKTLQSYNDHIQDYVAHSHKTVNGDAKAWIDKALTFVPAGVTILELGSGSGGEADYIESKGYKVTRTDAAQGFVDLLRKQGHAAQLLNALTDDFGTDIEMVFANAVLLHFTPGQVRDVLEKAYNSLKPDGILAFSVKRGKGEEWTEEKLKAPRYFHYWDKPKLKSVLTESGFQTLELYEGKSRNFSWLFVIARK